VAIFLARVVGALHLHWSGLDSSETLSPSAKEYFPMIHHLDGMQPSLFELKRPHTSQWPSFIADFAHLFSQRSSPWSVFSRSNDTGTFVVMIDTQKQVVSRQTMQNWPSNAYKRDCVAAGGFFFAPTDGGPY
jgi:hypothetical protein